MMDNSQKFLKMLSDFIEAGILTSQDLKKELLTSVKFKKENLVNNLDLVTREEFIILKKLIEKQQKEIRNLKKNKLRKFKKEKRS
jgi:BMFP domain-containing protein YqiC